MKRLVAIILCFAMLVLSCAFVVLTAEKLSDEKDEQNEFYLSDGYIIKTESKYNKTMADYAARLFTRIYDEQLQNSSSVYFALVPDKHRVVNAAYDFSIFEQYMRNSLPFADVIEISDLLTLSDYYRTDPHWKQECIVDVAQRLCESMDATFDTEFEVLNFNEPYVGVYATQSGLQTQSDVMSYLVWEGSEDVLTDGAEALYDLEKFYGDDPYDVFLSGNQPIVTLKNSSADNNKRLVIFRDSFASSIAPLMSSAYSEIVLVDIRYIMSDMLPEYVSFDNADVLFLYSTLLLNNSMSMK